MSSIQSWQDPSAEDSAVTRLGDQLSRPFFDLSELIRYRDLIRFLVWRDVKTLYSQTILGLGWAVMRPALSTLIFSVVFGSLAQVPSDGSPYPLFAFVGLLPWTYFATALTASATSLVSSSNLLNKVYFPRVIIPLTPVVAGLVDFAVGCGFLAILLFGYGVAPSASVVFLPLLVMIMLTTALASGLWLSALAIQYRDVKHAVGFLAQLLLYVAPVVWPVSLIAQRFPEDAAWLRIGYGLFPMAGVIEGFRSAVLSTGPMPWDLIGAGTVSAAVLLVTGMAYFRKRERLFADVA